MMAIGRSRYLYDTIKMLHQKGRKIDVIITDEAYEEYEVTATDFKMLAKEINAVFFQTKQVNMPEIQKLIVDNNIKLAISANWKYTLPKSFIDLFKQGILNFHLGNLPDYKGNATVNWSVINGLDYIFANVHKMEEQLDVGDVIARSKIPITENTYIGNIIEIAEKIVPELFVEAIDALEKNQDYYLIKGSASGLRCFPRSPGDSQINWKEPAEEIHRLIRASSHPYKGAYSYLDNEKIIVWAAELVKHYEPFLAIPGQITGIDKKEKKITVACGKGLITLTHIAFKNNYPDAGDFIKSIRSRFKFKQDD